MPKGILENQTVKDRFWEKVDKSGDCWEWTTGKTGGGYGQFWFNGKTQYAHRFSYELHHGPIPPGEGYHGTCVCHHCDNPSCVNPDHLYIGTQQDNMDDKAEKGRASRGEANYKAKLNEDDVKMIRCMRGHTQRALATLFGVSQAQVDRIINRKTWNHI